MHSDFIGFTFDGVHSSELNILRVSDGDRYEESLIPELDDKTVEAEGRDGVYYYGSFYKSKEIEIKIAFDSVTEEQYRNIRRLFGQKKICKLIFDERPYKVYYAKIANPISLETVCFDEPYKELGQEQDGIRTIERITNTSEVPVLDDGGNPILGENNEPVMETITTITNVREQITPWVVDRNRKRRIYKGEGSISFIAYDPFARQLYKTLDLYTLNGYNNVNEWADSSGILDKATYEAAAIDVYQNITNVTSIQFQENYTGQINVYNPGDIDSPYYLFIPYVNNEIMPAVGDYVYISIDKSPSLIIEPFERKNNSLAASENGIIINSRAELIEGVQYDYITQSWRTTGNIYNRYIKQGEFGTIVKGDKFSFRHQGIYLNCEVDNDYSPAIFYNYLYY